MTYRERLPCARLAPFVECFWSRDVRGNGETKHPVLPDGAIDLLFDSGEETVFAVGTMTRTLWVTSSGHRRFFGVRFRPGAASGFVRESAVHLTDEKVDARAIFGSKAATLAEEIADDEHALERFLLARIERAAFDPRVMHATYTLANDPTMSVDTLAHAAGLTRQHLRRLFLERVGVSPKAFAGTMRLQKLAAHLKSPATLADAAMAAGYTDQAHMTREFVALVGMTPRRYRALSDVPNVQDAAVTAA